MAKRPKTAKRYTREEITAYHEAGHAVMAKIVGVKIAGTSIVPNPEEGTLGHSIHPCWEGFDPSVECIGERDLTENELELRVRKLIMVSFGGVAAISVLTGKSPHKQWGWEMDRQNIINVSSYVVGPGEEETHYLQWLLYKSINTFRHPFRWRMVDTLATVLLEDKTLSGPQVHAVLRSCRPKL